MVQCLLIASAGSQGCRNSARGLAQGHSQGRWSASLQLAFLTVTRWLPQPPASHPHPHPRQEKAPCPLQKAKNNFWKPSPHPVPPPRPAVADSLPAHCPGLHHASMSVPITARPPCWERAIVTQLWGWGRAPWGEPPDQHGHLRQGDGMGWREGCGPGTAVGPQG